MSRRPMHQGKLDGLCGFYSVINSYLSLGHLKDDNACTRLMKKLIDYKSTLFPSVMYTGTTITQVVDIVNESSAILKVDVDISRPFTYKNKVSTKSQFLKGLEPYIVPGHSLAILGLGKPWNHWTVLTSISDDKFNFYDSIGLNNLNISDIVIKKTTDMTKVMVSARDTIVIHNK